MRLYFWHLSVLCGCLVALFVFSLTSAPPQTYALGSAADAMCNPVITSCSCGMVPGPKGCVGGANKFMCPCFDITNEFKSVGVCMAPNKCLGQSLGGMAPMLPMIMPPMMMPMMPMTPQDMGLEQCYTGRYTTTVASTTDPCADYVPNLISDFITGGSNVSGGLLDALKGGTNTNTQTGVSGTSQGGMNTSGSRSSQTQTGSQTSQPSNAAQLSPGLSGDVRLGGAGATIIANLRDGLSEVASFFGGSTLGSSQSLSVAGRLCASRPWSSGFIGNVIPSSFFDGLCEWRGYQVGVAITSQASKTASGGTGTSQSGDRQRSGYQLPASDVPPEADIWAEPASVRLGTRTYIFWNARGVAMCEERGPSFEQHSLSGGASTVPLSGATTFTIECLTSASTTISDSVTVQIAI